MTNGAARAGVPESAFSQPSVSWKGRGTRVGHEGTKTPKVLVPCDDTCSELLTNFIVIFPGCVQSRRINSEVILNMLFFRQLLPFKEEACSRDAFITLNAFGALHLLQRSPDLLLHLFSIAAKQITTNLAHSSSGHKPG